jgi:hypothetical protein
MLHLHHSLLPHLPSLSHGSHVLQLSPVTSDNDELIQAIEEEHRKDSWQLDATDAQSLDEFWTGVEEDLKKDPEWFTFADD